MKKFSIYMTIFLAAAAMLTGCKRKEHTPPPEERVGLVVRFFKSMENNDSAAAVRRGHNLIAVDRTQNNVRTLVHLQESNEAVVAAQKQVDKGNINAAINIIEKALRLYPKNTTLESARSKLRQLRNAKSLINAMNKARNSSAMSSARSAAETGLSQNITPELQAFLNEYKQKEIDRAAHERKFTQKSLDDATDAAEKAKAEDAAREAENLRFMKMMAEKTAVGEKMRKEAGEVPFAPDAGVSTDRK